MQSERVTIFSDVADIANDSNYSQISCCVNINFFSYLIKITHVISLSYFYWKIWWKRMHFNLYLMGKMRNLHKTRKYILVDFPYHVTGKLKNTKGNKNPYTRALRHCRVFPTMPGCVIWQVFPGPNFKQHQGLTRVCFRFIGK